MKPYCAIPIQECHEPMVRIPLDRFAFFDPHPYVACGAPYGEVSPWILRKSIVASLIKAQKKLQTLRPGWKILLFDAYRPNAVQAFMVARELTMLAHAKGLRVEALSEDEHAGLMSQVYRLFAVPSDDPSTPPPHSTGATFDCTLVDQNGCEIDMGSPLDENSDRSDPNYFEHAQGAREQQAHANRVLLHDVLNAQGFRRNPSEWWHFSRGDQLAVWSEFGNGGEHVAIYGRADLV